MDSINLIDLVDNNITDKNTIHSYLDLYQLLFKNKRLTAKNILEVGIFNGGSIKLWNDFFTNANIYGIDICEYKLIYNDLFRYNDNVVLLCNSNAYDYDFFNYNFLIKNIKFDIVIDDGPHTLDSMISFIKLYSQILTDDGILIIEDIQDFSWLDILINNTPNDLKKYIKIYDLRDKKNRYDDIVFSIDKYNI